MAQEAQAAAARKIAEAIFEELNERIVSEDIYFDFDGRPRVTICGEFDTDTDALDLETLDVEFGETSNGTHWPLPHFDTVEELAKELEEAFGIHEDCERENAAYAAEEDARREAIEA